MESRILLIYRKIIGYSWLITGEYNRSNWSEYVNAEGERGLEDSWRASLGAVLSSPAMLLRKEGRRSYFSEIEYRFGGFYENTNLLIDNQPVTVKGASFGFSLPFIPKNSLPYDRKINHLSFGIIVGSKSSSANSIITEDFINLTFGITLNDLWFRPRKYR